MSDLENLYIKRNEAYKVNDIETVNNITEELNNLYPVKPKSVLCIDGKPVQFEIMGIANNVRWIGDFPCLTIINGEKVYNRILIRRKSFN